MKVIEVTADLITPMFTSGYVLNKKITIKEGLPQGCRLVDVKFSNGVVSYTFMEKDEHPTVLVVEQTEILRT